MIYNTKTFSMAKREAAQAAKKEKQAREFRAFMRGLRTNKAITRTAYIKDKCSPDRPVCPPYSHDASQTKNRCLLDALLNALWWYVAQYVLDCLNLESLRQYAIAVVTFGVANSSVKPGDNTFTKDPRTVCPDIKTGPRAGTCLPVLQVMLPHPPPPGPLSHCPPLSTGTYYSTFTGYIHRLRGYHGLGESTYYHTKGKVCCMGDRPAWKAPRPLTSRLANPPSHRCVLSYILAGASIRGRPTAAFCPQPHLAPRSPIHQVLHPQMAKSVGNGFSREWRAGWTDDAGGLI